MGAQANVKCSYGPVDFEMFVDQWPRGKFKACLVGILKCSAVKCTSGPRIKVRLVLSNFRRLIFQRADLFCVRYSSRGASRIAIFKFPGLFYRTETERNQTVSWSSYI